MNTATHALPVLFLMAAPAAWAQQHEHAATTAPPAILVAGMGRLHHAIATKSGDARNAIPPESDCGINKAKTMLEITDAVLDAWIARARRDDHGFSRSRRW